jgi:hypothetical protein
VRRALVVLMLGCAPVTVAWAGVNVSSFRYERTLSGGSTRPVVLFEPDEAMLGHARPGLADLRIVDAKGVEVPWRSVRARPQAAQRVRALDSGRRGREAVALFDLGPRRVVRDRLVLDVVGRNFVGRATVEGADRRAGPFTRLGSTTIYDVSGARHAHSTEVTFPPSDFRYLFVRATGVRAIAAASVAGRVGQKLVGRSASERVSTSGRHTDVVLDFGYPRVPFREVHVSAATPTFNRPAEVAVSEDGRSFTPVAFGRVAAFPGSTQGPIRADARAHFVRIRIDNGDDPPLRGVRAQAFDVSRAIAAEGGHPLPYRLYYGDPALGAPSYDFARLPQRFTLVFGATVGPETANASYRPPRVTRSFFARHGWLVKGALALAAIVVAGAGLAALRRT